MSNYKLIEVVKTAERETQSIYDKDDLAKAISDMHNDFGVAVKTDATVSVYCTLIDQETGEKVENLHWMVLPGPDTGDVMIRQRVYTHNNFSEDNIAAYDTERLAIGNYHTKLSSQRNNAECYRAITIRLNMYGDIVDSDSWTKPIEQTT